MVPAIAPAPEAFAALATRLMPTGPRVVDDDEWSLGPMPDYLAGLDFVPNTLLTTPRKLAAADVRAAALAIPPDEYRDRNRWRNLIAPLATIATEHSELDAEMRHVMHAASSRVGAFTSETFPRGYDTTANEAAFDTLMAETAARLAKGSDVLGVGSLYREAKRFGWPGPQHDAANDDEARPAVAVPPVANLKALDIAQGFSTYEKRKPVHGADLYRGYVTNVSGPGGSAKSSWATGVALAVATGRDLMGEKVPKRGHVLFINAEDRRGEVMLRFQAAMMMHRVSLDEVEERITVAGAENIAGLRLSRVNDGTRREEVDTLGFALLRSWVRGSGASLMVLDPLVALMPYGTNDGGIAGAVMRELTAIATEFDCAVMVVQHTRKGGTADSEGTASAAGSVALINLARVAIGFVRVSEEEGRKIGVQPGQAERIRAIVNVKANLAPLMERRFIQLSGLGMGNGTPDYPEQDWVAAAVPYTPCGAFTAYPDTLLRGVLSCITKGAPGGAAFSPSPGARGGRNYVSAVSALVAQHMPDVELQHRDRTAKALVDELTQRGWLGTTDVRVPKSTGSGSNTNKGLVAIWSATPWANTPAPVGHVA